MNEHVPNPAVEFDWPTATESDAPLVARVHGESPSAVPVERPELVATVSEAQAGRSREELAEHLAGATDLDPSAAAARIEELVEAGVLVPEDRARRQGREWHRHGWRRSLYYHLATRDWSPDERGDAAASPGDAERPPDAATRDTTDGRGDGEPIPLPEPDSLPDRPLDEVLLDRRTCREFDGTPMDHRDLSTLLDAALGPVRDVRGRETARDARGSGTARDAGGCENGSAQVATGHENGSARDAGGHDAAHVGLAYQEAASFPFAVRPVVARSPNLEAGSYRYLLDDHALQPLDADAGATPEAVDETLRETVVGQPFVEGGAVTLLVTADLDAYRRLHDGPGALRQLFTAVSAHVHRCILAATAMGFDCFQSAAFDDGRAAAVAGTDSLAEPVVYLLTVGTGVAR